MMVFSMIGIGIAWASILAMPYAILSDSLPANKMGTYMGIFNFFITIPQITNGIIHGWIVRNVYHGHAVVFSCFSPLPRLVLSKRKSSVEKCKVYKSGFLLSSVKTLYPSQTASYYNVGRKTYLR